MDEITSNRMESVDQFRGFAIISMIIVNFLAFYQAAPWYLKHARGIGYTVADLVAPFFIFIIGLVYRRSFLKRVASEGRKRAWIHMAQRYLLLATLGFGGTWIAEGRVSFEWGVLQAIGVAGILALFFIEAGFWMRTAAALLMLALYQLFLFPSLQYAITFAKHGGIWAAISWGAMLLLATVAGELIDTKKLWASSKRLAVYGLVLFLCGLVNSMLVPISKMEVNSTYVLISTGLSAFAFNIMFVLIEKYRLNIPALKKLGKNALFIYILHYVLIQIIHRFIPQNAAPVSVGFGTLIICLLCYGAAWYMDCKKMYLKL